MLRNFLNNMRGEKNIESAGEKLLPAVQKQTKKCNAEIIFKIFMVSAYVILIILIIIQHNKYEELKEKNEFNRAINIVINTEEEMLQYRTLFYYYNLNGMGEEIGFYRQRLSMVTSVEELEEVINDYYNWKIMRGLEEPPKDL